jgi:hypothetical protein
MTKLSKYTLFVLEHMKKIPDKRTGKNTMYTIPQLGMTALAAFFSRSNSLRKFLLSLPGFKDDDMNTFFVSLTYGDKPDGLPRKIPTDNHIRSQLDGVPPAIFHEALWSLVEDILEDGGARYRLAGRTVVVPFVARHYSSESIACPLCLSKSYETVRRRAFKVEHFHSLAGFSLFGEPKTIPQLPPEFLGCGDFPGMRPGITFRGAAGDDSPEPSLPEVLGRWNLSHSESLKSIRPVFVLRHGLGTFKALTGIAEGQDFILLPNGETKDLIRRKAPELLGAGYVELDDYEDDTQYEDLGPTLSHHGFAEDGLQAWALPNAKLDQILPNVSKQEKTNRLVLTSIPPDEWDLGRIGRVVNILAEFNFQHELRAQGFSLTRNFGHGRRTLSEVMAVLNFLALDLFYLTKF